MRVLFLAVSSRQKEFMSKKIAAAVLLAMICAGLYGWLRGESPPAFELEEGFALLVDDGSLEGWSVIGGQATFEATGDEVIGRRGPGENTFLRTDKFYGDFELRLQMRWDEAGNSGILLRSHQAVETGRAYGYQYELDPSERAWSGGIYDEARRGWIANLEGNEEARQAIRLADWNDVRIEARGASIKTWINGVAAADIVDGLDAVGFIALQVHSGDSGVIRWRHIRIKEFTPAAQSGVGLEQNSDWLTEGISEFSVQKKYPWRPVRRGCGAFNCASSTRRCHCSPGGARL